MQSGKDLVISALNFKEVERVPWVPFTGVHVAKLIDMDAETFLKDSDAIARGVIVAAERYRADGVCSMFDLQVEAEVLGCDLKWSRNNPPAVVSHVLEDGRPISDLPEFSRDKGRIELCLDATKKIVDEDFGKMEKNIEKDIEEFIDENAKKRKDVGKMELNLEKKIEHQIEEIEEEVDKKLDEDISDIKKT